MRHNAGHSSARLQLVSTVFYDVATALGRTVNNYGYYEWGPTICAMGTKILYSCI